MDIFLTIKWVHILSATILFGMGLGTAFHMWMAHLRRDIAGLAIATRHTVRADWMFTLPSAIVQPISGLALVSLAGYGFFEDWLLVTYALYILAGSCWVFVVAIQIRVARIVSETRASGTELPMQYDRLMRWWFVLGWPAFLSLIAIFWLMINRPDAIFGGAA